MNADTLIAAVWRATAKAIAGESRSFDWSIERARAVRAAEHVETMLRLTDRLYNQDRTKEDTA
jgi:hypothetical protein